MADENHSKVIFAELVALVPQDVLKAQIRASIAQDVEESKNEIPFPKGKDEKEVVRLVIDPTVPEEAKTKITEEFKRIFADKTCAGLEVENTTTEEEINETAKTVAEDLVRGWVNVLMNCVHEAGHNNFGRLDDNLLPTMSPSIFFIDPNETYMDYIARMVYQDVGEEQAKIIYMAFKDKAKEEIHKNPNGLEFFNDLLINWDERGYFLTHKV